MTTFQGVPAGAFEFYSELQDNNNRQWWLDNRERHKELVREPLEALLAELEPRFGPGTIFRPYRDMRFSHGQAPLKTAQGAFACTQEGVGYYLHISAGGLQVGGGYRSYSPAQLGRYRNAVDASGTGETLRLVVAAIAGAGFAVEGEVLKTVPRGYARHHPRADLLRHRTLSAGLDLGRPAWLATPESVHQVAELWEHLRPLVDWVGRHASP